MVNLKKPEKIQAELDKDFISFIESMDTFIQEMHEENKKLAEIRELRQKNKILVAEIQKLQNELHQENNVADLKNKTESDIKFERNIKIFDILMYILWAELGLLIGLDIVMIIKAFSN